MFSLFFTPSVDFGPFRLSGTYSRRSENLDLTSSQSDGTFKIPGAQIIGVINTIVPFSVPDSGQ